MVVKEWIMEICPTGTSCRCEVEQVNPSIIPQVLLNKHLQPSHKIKYYSSLKMGKPSWTKVINTEGIFLCPIINLCHYMIIKETTKIHSTEHDAWQNVQGAKVAWNYTASSALHWWWNHFFHTDLRSAMNGSQHRHCSTSVDNHLNYSQKTVCYNLNNQFILLLIISLKLNLRCQHAKW